MPPRLLKLVKGFSTPQEPDMLQAAIERFLATKAALDENSIRHYRKVLKLYQKLSPDWPPSQAGMVRFIAHCQAHYTDGTTQVYWTVVKMFVGWLVRRKLIADNPYEDLSDPVKPDDIPRAPPAASLEKLFSYLEKKVEEVIRGKKKYGYFGWREVRNLALFSLLLDTGLRINEALNIQLADIDLENWSVFVARGKGHKQRYVAIGRTARADLRLWLKVRGSIPMLPGTPGVNHLFICRRSGWQPLTLQSAENILRRACEKIEIEPAITPHKLRHGYVVYSLQQGGNIEWIRQQMGHSNLTTTARYARSLGEERIKHHLKTSPRDFLF